MQSSRPAKRAARTGIQTLAISSLTGLALWTVRRGDPVLPYLVIGNAIGFSVVLFGRLLRRAAHGRLGLGPRLLIVVPLSVVAGVELAAAILGRMPGDAGHFGIGAWLNFGPAFLAAGLIYAMFSLSHESGRMRAALETERRVAAELRQSETAARLALLQAQIEPHFLFNTLANVQSLVDRDPARAASMLDNLNRYLRASLGRTRTATTTLAEEVELVEALLRIASIRLGGRLRYAIDIPEAMRALAFAPLLLQPLVENALRHGIEPALDGGAIRIAARRSGNRLELGVTDTGVGFDPAAVLHRGVGLANVRARLNALYGDDARLTVSGNTVDGRGVIATLQLPLP